VGVQAVARAVAVVGPVAAGARVEVEVELDPVAAVLADQAVEGLEGPLLPGRAAHADVAEPLAAARRHQLRARLGQPRALADRLDLAPQPELHAPGAGVVRERADAAR